MSSNPETPNLPTVTKEGTVLTRVPARPYIVAERKMKKVLLDCVSQKYVEQLLVQPRFTDMWEAIKTTVVQDVDTKREEIHNKLMNLRWTGKMEKVLLYFSNLVATYRSLNGSFSDSQLAHQLLSAVPKEYDHTVIALRREAIENDQELDLEKVKKVLTIAATQIQRSSPKTFEASGYNGYGGQPKRNFEKRGANRFHDDYNRQTGKPLPTESNLKTMPCFNCGEKGHWFKDCPHPPKKQPRNSFGSNGASSSSRTGSYGSQSRYGNQSSYGGGSSTAGTSRGAANANFDDQRSEPADSTNLNHEMAGRQCLNSEQRAVLGTRVVWNEVTNEFDWLKGDVVIGHSGMRGDTAYYSGNLFESGTIPNQRGFYSPSTRRESAFDGFKLESGDRLGHGCIFAVDSGSSLHTTNNFDLLTDPVKTQKRIHRELLHYHAQVRRERGDRIWKKPRAGEPLVQCQGHQLTQSLSADQGRADGGVRRG